MPNAIKMQVFRLVKSLDKSEKRNFKLYAKRSAANSGSKFIQLFDLIDKLEAPDDDFIKKKMALSPGQYSNLKRHLYQQILASLRLIYISKELDIELRESIDFAHILYGKGLYLDALRLLDRAEDRAKAHGRDIILLEILEFQKKIESRHITLSRQEKNRMDGLVNESAKRSYSVLNTSELFNMHIVIHGRYIDKGHSRNQKEWKTNREFWLDAQKPRVGRSIEPETFHQKINRFQADMWYHYIQLDFSEALEHTRECLALFAYHDLMKLKDPDLFLRSLYYAVVMAYLSGDQPSMTRYHQRLRNFIKDGRLNLNRNTQHISRIYGGLSSINNRMVVRDWVGALARAKKALDPDPEDGPTSPINAHRKGLIQYKAAAAAFMLGDYDQATDYLLSIVNLKTSSLRADLRINTRLLQVLCHYEMDNFELIDYNLTNLSRLLRNNRERAEVHTLLISGIRRLIRALPRERDAILAQLHEEIDAQTSDPFEVKALTYLDSRLWIARRRKLRSLRPALVSPG